MSNASGARPLGEWREFVTPQGARRLSRQVTRAVNSALKDAPEGSGVYLELGGGDGPRPRARAAPPFPPGDPFQFQEYLKGRKPAVFWSLSGAPTPTRPRGTRLVVPPVPPENKRGNAAAPYGDVANYVRKVPESEKIKFWQQVAKEAAAAVRKGHKVYVYTHGRDVPWLHVRLEVKTSGGCPGRAR